MAEERIIHTTGINNCGGRCIIHAHVKDGQVVRISSDQSKGSLNMPPLRACSRGMQYHKTYLDPKTRLHTPLRRVGARGSGEWQEIGWEEAVELIASEWIRIREQYGPASRYVSYGWGVSGLMNPNKLGKHLLALDGGYLEDYNNYSNACLTSISTYTFGTSRTGNSMSALLDAKLIILWGHNPAATRFDSNMYYLRQARDRGIPIICIDPRYSETTRELKAEWIPIRPATDGALADAMAYEIISQNLQDHAFIDACCQGFTRESMPEGYEDEEDYFSYVKGLRDGCPKNAEWAEEITGIPAKKIRELALRYAKAKPAALTQGYGPQRHLNGEQNARGPLMLACLTGNVGKSGGWSGGGYSVANPPEPKFPRAENPFPGEIPVYRWTDALENSEALTQKDGLRGVDKLPVGIKMILNLAGNCLINQHGDINQSKALLQDESLCEFIVTSDLFMTPSAQYSDLVLPALSFLEMNNITGPWVAGNFIAFANQVVEPMAGCRFEYDWLKEVAQKLGLYDAFTMGHATADDWIRDCYEQHRKTWNPRMQALMQCEEQPEAGIPDQRNAAEKAGQMHRRVEAFPPYEEIKDSGILRFPDWPEQVAFRQNVLDPKGHPWDTPSGRIEIFSTTLADKKDASIPAIPRYLPVDSRMKRNPEYPVFMTGFHTRRRCHSAHDSNQDMERIDPQRLHMNELDARRRGIQDGDRVLVYNERGRILVKVRVSAEIMEGVAAMAEGAWYTPDGKGTDFRGSSNVLTSLMDTPLAHGNGQHTVFVEVKKAE